ALTRLPNGSVPSLQPALAAAAGYDLHALLQAPGRRLDQPRDLWGTSCASHADLIELFETVASRLYADLEIDGFQPAAISAVVTAHLGKQSDEVERVLAHTCGVLVPALERVTDEVGHVLTALDGRYVPPGPAGAPTRGMTHTLPTGRNFYAVDPRAV